MSKLFVLALAIALVSALSEPTSSDSASQPQVSQPQSQPQFVEFQRGEFYL